MSTIQYHRTLMRKRKLRWTVALLISFALASVVLPAREMRVRAQAARPPNILIIMTDDQRADRASRRVMPATRRIFMRKGAHYRNAVATTPLCCPSRASIFSGKYAHNHGVHSNSDGEDFDPDESMQALLEDAGYQTAYSGKYLNAPLKRPPHFDYWSIMNGGHQYYNVRMHVNGEYRIIRGYISRFIRKKALDFLGRFESRDARPWFMIVAPYAPHAPARPERKYKGSWIPRWKENPATREDSPRELRDKPRYVRNTQINMGNVKRLRRRQLRSLKSVDDTMTRIFRKLRRTGENKNTLAIYLSDNGYMWTEHGLDKKRYPYDMSVKIPMYMRWPGHVKKGVVRRKIVGNIDVAPTVYEASRVPATYPVDGRSMFGPFRRDDILIESYRDPQFPEVPPWKGLWKPGPVYVEYKSGAKEYYGKGDKWQLRNRLGNKKKGDDPNNQARLRARLRAYRDCKGPTCP